MTPVKVTQEQESAIDRARQEAVARIQARKPQELKG